MGGDDMALSVHTLCGTDEEEQKSRRELIHIADQIAARWARRASLAPHTH